MVSNSNSDRTIDDWLRRLQPLIDDAQQWAAANDWSTRVIEIKREDSRFGVYQAPALLLQKDATRILLEPISRAAPGVDGVVDLYLVPAYDDIATIYHDQRGWRIHYMYPDSPTVGDIRDAQSHPFTQESFCQVLDEMTKHALN